MRSPGRYQRRAAFAEQQGVSTWVGVDAVTGLSVLIYDSPEPPRVEAEALESEHIPGVLATAFDGVRGELVTAFASQYRLLEADDVDDATVAAAATALRDAADEGVVHGDLRPGRFLIASGILLVEGYGVPWRPKDERFSAPERTDSLAADVYMFAASFLDLGRDRISPETVALLVRATADDPADRPDASALAAELHRIVELRGPSRPVAYAHAAFDDGRRPATVDDADDDPDDAEPIVIDSDPGDSPLRVSPGSGRFSSGSFSKEPPPGTRYRAGDEAPAPPPGRFTFSTLHDSTVLGTGARRWYRFVMLGLTILLAAVLAVLALSRQRDRVADPSSQRSMVYVIDVAVEPPNLPPVTLVVVESPDASTERPGTALATVPGRVVLDSEGVWRLQGRFQERLSQVVTLHLPEQRAVTLSFATPATTGEP